MHSPRIPNPAAPRTARESLATPPAQPPSAHTPPAIASRDSRIRAEGCSSARSARRFYDESSGTPGRFTIGNEHQRGVFRGAAASALATSGRKRGGELLHNFDGQYFAQRSEEHTSEL